MHTNDKQKLFSPNTLISNVLFILTHMILICKVLLDLISFLLKLEMVLLLILILILLMLTLLELALGVWVEFRP